MKIVILYNMIVPVAFFILSFVLRLVCKSNLSKNKQFIVKVIGAILFVCVTAFVIFLDAIAVGIIGPVPN